MLRLYHAPLTRAVRVREDGPVTLCESGAIVEHLLASGFSAAAVMMGFTLGAAAMLGVLDARFPRVQAYWERLQRRPALRRALYAGPA